ncbi:hypothetical protein [Gloeobacter violaceus]|uniref:Glr2597 protein n=1 Tax=Gloeobacter violaceus (strain ATCC 29082 / PCC 7421) TaxID=251221 RepID=Q7NHE0_GLOVI|nr:hypothetical protein [Gloeobacter violaceus]BAC90538.1 glr2597 [Gloeobacter violaceus PCC 7421]
MPEIHCRVLAGCLAVAVGTALSMPLAASAQEQSAAAAAAAVRKAPFSKVFTVGKAAFVKDKDYNPSEPNIQFFSLWIDAPAQKAFEVAVRYCVPEQDVSGDQAFLAEMVLLDGSRPLVRISRVLDTQRAREKQARPARYNPPVVVGGLYGGFYGGYVVDPGSYFPEIKCSAGSTRFDLAALKKQIAGLPNRTLKVQLLFSNGVEQGWQLGGATVQALKQLPGIKKFAAPPA